MSTSSRCCPAWPPRTRGNGRWRRSTSTWPQSGTDLRHRRRAHRRRAGRRAAVVEFSRGAAARPVAALAGFAAVRDRRKAQGAAGFEEGEEVDPELAAARGHLEAGDFDAARAAYQAILDGNPASAEAKGAIRQIDFLTRATAQRPDAVAVADAAPGDIDAALAAADVEILNQDVNAAFERLIALVRTTSGDERTRVRTRLVELFELFDPADPEVVVGRRNLANALY